MTPPNPSISPKTQEMSRTITINLDTHNITTTGDFTLPEALATATYLTGYYVGAIKAVYGPHTATQCARNLAETWNRTLQHFESNQ